MPGQSPEDAAAIEQMEMLADFMRVDVDAIGPEPGPLVHGTTMAVGFARLGTTLGACAHRAAVPVDLLLTGERVAWLCPECNVQLPAGWSAVSYGDVARCWVEEAQG